MGASEFCCNPSGDPVWVSAGPQWKETYTVLGKFIKPEDYVTVWSLLFCLLYFLLIKILDRTHYICF